MRTHSGLLVLTLALGATSCTVGPDYVQPKVDTPSSFRFAQPGAVDLANSAWWEQFQDPVLNQLISVALQENKDVQIAAARVDAFRGQFETTRSQLFPQVGSNASAERERASEVGPTPLAGSGPVFKQYQANLSVAWELDLFGKLRRQTEAARASLLASEEGRRGAILSLVASVASSYINLRDLDRQLAITNATVASRSEAVKVFSQRFAGGVVSQMELAQSQSEYEAALAIAPQIQAQIAQQENALSVLLGRNPGPILRGRELSDLKQVAVPSGLPSDLLIRRPDLAEAEQNLIAANALIGAARAQYFPTISLTGFLGSLSAQSADLFTGPAKVWSYAANVSLPIFTAGGIGGQVKQAEAQQQEALLQYQKSIQVAFQETEDALIGLQKNREQLVTQGRQVEALRTYAHLARLRFDGGYTSYIEVLDAERSLFNAELSYAQTEGTVYTSLVNLYKAMGGGWVVEADRMTAKAAPPEAAQAKP
ncbi:efflux transporter outer membrane subunit [Pseudomonas sp. NA-150]|uniref:efflux transporter outer membrane subunit n=1 Tax=Pseudomonas sp. NA-150 TaxID=3367525 RepID=UPI0037C7B5C2